MSFIVAFCFEGLLSQLHFTSQFLTKYTFYWNTISAILPLPFFPSSSVMPFVSHEGRNSCAYCGVERAI